MAKEGSSSQSSAPTLGELHRALEVVSTSIGEFERVHAEWHMYHQACLPIVGHAWQDHQTELSSHVGSIRGLRALRTAVAKEIQWIERHAADVGRQTVFTSSNAFYLTTSWQHVLYSALHQSPILELDAYMPTDDGQSTKVDIVCQGGRKWIRLSTVKPLSLLSEFRSAESYVVDDDDEDDEPRLSLDLIKSQLAQGQVDGIASQCSIMKMARELQKAASVAQHKSQWGRPLVDVALTRLSLDDMSTSLEGKFYDDAEKDRFEARLRAMVAEMERMQLLVLLKDQRQLCEGDEEVRYLPSSIASGQAAGSERVTPLPTLPLPHTIAATVRPTTTLNLDLSALVAFVSQISHLPLSHLDGVQDADKCFRRDHWKLDTPAAEEGGEETDRGAHTQHARALSDQLRREMTTDSFFDAVLQHLPADEPLRLVCTKEAQDKFHEILALVGGSTEQQRGKSLFAQYGHDVDFWRGSRWEGDTRVRQRIALPVEAVAFDGASVAAPLPASKDDDDSFARLATRSVRDGLADLVHPAATNMGTGLQRQTPHTLASMLYGLQRGCSTLTTNMASVKWLLRDITRAQQAEASTKGHVLASQPGPFAFAVLFYPRSLAEKMMTAACLHPPVLWSNGAMDATGGRTQSESLLDKSALCSAESSSSSRESDGSPTALAHRTPDGKLGRAQRAVRRWLRGPRPHSLLTIRHYAWWPLQPIEERWLRWTAPLAWKDPAKMHPQGSPGDVEGQRPVASMRNEGKGSAQLDWKRNRLHWTALALTFIAWAFGFTFLVRGLWYEASVVDGEGDRVTPSFFGCTTTFWTANSACGLNGILCAPFSSPTSVPFRCPAECETTTLGGRRAVGNELPAYVPLVVGGGASSDGGPLIYRGDSFVCSAAIHAGVLPSATGGCGSVWLNGAYSGYEGVDRNGIQSTAFNSTFPVSFYFEPDAAGEQCTDRSDRGYILNVILLAWLGFVLQPKSIVYFFSLVVVGFWHINFISEPRRYPMSVGDPMGDFLPTLFVAYALWRLTFRRVWPAFERLPLERNVWIQGFFWIGVLLNLVFAKVPLNRLVASDITSQPGALTALIVIVIVVLVIALNQIRVIRKVGKLPKYLTLTIVGAIIIGLLAAIPTTGLRLHHYIIALVLLPYCAFPTRLSLIYSAFLLGMFLNGVGRWGYDGLVQDVATIRGAGIIGTGLPAFLPPSNWTGVAEYGGANDSTSLVHWQPIPSNQTDEWDSFQLLVDDILRVQSGQTSFNISQLAQYYLNLDSTSSGLFPASNLSLYPGGDSSLNVQDSIAMQPHYLRLAYYNTNTANLGDFTEAATVFFNGTFVAPGPGAT